LVLRRRNRLVDAALRHVRDFGLKLGNVLLWGKKGRKLNTGKKRDT